VGRRVAVGLWVLFARERGRRRRRSRARPPLRATVYKVGAGGVDLSWESLLLTLVRGAWAAAAPSVEGAGAVGAVP
jgi:hypothetical protein